MKNNPVCFIIFLLVFSCSSDDNDNIQEGLENLSYTLSVSTTVGGVTDSQGGIYEEGEVVTITASAIEGYLFQNWTGDENSDENPIVLIMNSDINITANFEELASSLIPMSIYERVYGTTSDIYIEGDWVYINTNGVPDHQSPYFQNTQWEDNMYVAYDGSNPFVTNFHLNPNRISELSISFKIPINPEQSSENNPTAMGPIGVSLNGIPFYNQYAGGGAPLTQEINSFDQYNGHPAPLGPGQENNASGRYHYHIEPFWLTSNHGKEALIGFLLDGFPVYGPEENGQAISSSDLDAFHGHFHSNSDFPDGIYHYHVTADDPYINGSGYYGSPGTVTN